MSVNFNNFYCPIFPGLSHISVPSLYLHVVELEMSPNTERTREKSEWFFHLHRLWYRGFIRPGRGRLMSRVAQIALDWAAIISRTVAASPTTAIWILNVGDCNQMYLIGQSVCNFDTPPQSPSCTSTSTRFLLKIEIVCTFTFCAQ